MTQAVPGSLCPHQSLCMKKVVCGPILDLPANSTGMRVWMTQGRPSCENTVQNVAHA